MKELDVEALKIVMKKAAFTGNAFLTHCEALQKQIEGHSDEFLTELAEKDSELEKLVESLNVIGEKLQLV